MTLENSYILNRIKDIKTIGKSRDITKTDIMDTFLLLLFFKNKGNVIQSDVTILPTIRLIDIHPDNNEKEKHKRLEYIIKDILKEKRIDGATTSNIDSINAKTNLAKIMYFIALDASDAIVVENPVDKQKIKQFISISNTHGTLVQSNRIKYTDEEENKYIKNLFIIASSLAQNEVTIDGGVTEIALQQQQHIPVLSFVNDIIDINTLFKKPDNDGMVQKLQSTLKQPTPVNSGFSKSMITFDTQLPNIKDATDYSVNLRIIQTVLIGKNVQSSNTQIEDLPHGTAAYVSNIIDMLFKAFDIDSSALKSSK